MRPRLSAVDGSGSSRLATHAFDCTKERFADALPGGGRILGSIDVVIVKPPETPASSGSSRYRAALAISTASGAMGLAVSADRQGRRARPLPPAMNRRRETPSRAHLIEHVCATRDRRAEVRARVVLARVRDAPRDQGSCRWSGLLALLPKSSRAASSMP